ncbi:restriction endonuclease [Plantibacter sp. CFBP 8798]|uniref:restriction endonuclease n=1 Tax=Plantibacter sp. CFBP 8798 TaxID=2775268 RepID=UPI00177CD479|nr:restriction endonuclease [Plantibacter sp. CFBP 8798]
MAESASPTDEPQLLHDRIATELWRAGHADDLDAAQEIAEALIEPVRVFIIDAQTAASNAGQAWTLEVYGSEDEYVRGSSTEDVSLSTEERQIRANRLHIGAIHEALINLDDVQFEHACTAILRLMGSLNPQTSPRRDDGGIDFYGRLELVGRLDNLSPYGGIDHRVGLWLVGQAKHYPTRPIQTAHIRELVGSVELARTGGAIHIWQGMNLRPFDATVMLLFTTGNFSSGAHRLLNKTGIIAMSGIQLSTFLADAGVGINQATFTFDAVSFREDLAIPS